MTRLPPSSHRHGLAEKPQPRDAAVRKDVQPRVRDGADVDELALENVRGVRLELRLRENLTPLFRQRATARGEPSLQRATLGEVPLEMRRVHFDSNQLSRASELENSPIVPRPAPPASFPAVRHALGAPWHDEVLPAGEQLVARRQHAAAVLQPSEIDEAPLAEDLLPIWRDVAVEAKTSHAPVRVDMQANVRPRFIAGDRK